MVEHGCVARGSTTGVRGLLYCTRECSDAIKWWSCDNKLNKLCSASLPRCTAVQYPIHPNSSRRPLKAYSKRTRHCLQSGTRPPPPSARSRKSAVAHRILCRRLVLPAISLPFSNGSVHAARYMHVLQPPQFLNPHFSVQGFGLFSPAARTVQQCQLCTLHIDCTGICAPCVALLLTERLALEHGRCGRRR